MKYTTIYKDPLVYWPITQFIDYTFMNQLQCPIPLFTFLLYTVIFFYKLFLKKNITFKTKTPLLISVLGFTLLVPTFFTSVFQTQSLVIHSIDRHFSIVAIFFLVLYYGKRIHRKIDTIIVMMFNYIVVAVLFYFYKIIENGYIIDPMTLRDGLSLFGTNSFIAFVFCFCLLLKSMGKLKEYYFFLTTGSIMSVIYVSRGGFAFALLLVAVELVHRKDVIKKFLLVIVIALAGYYIMANNPMVSDRLFSGLQGVQDGTVYTDNNRAYIFEFSCSYLKQPQNAYVWFCGLGLDQFRYINPWGYSDPHNTLLDTIFIAGISFCLAVLCMMINIVRKTKCKITYLAFFTYVVFEGVGIIHLKGEMSSAYLLFLLSLTYYYYNTSCPRQLAPKV